jgi:hypothetical protein
MICKTLPLCCLGKFRISGVLIGALLVGLTQTATAQTCLQDEYNKVNKQKLNCSANDVRVAAVSNVTDLSGNPLSTCDEGTTFSFLANFNIVTTANAANSGGRDNIGLYFQTDPAKSDALFGSCVDNIIAPLHHCTDGTGPLCGTSGYQEFDAKPDNCGDTSSSVNGNIGDEILVSNFVCTTANSAPCPNDPSKQCLTLPNCTSWQTSGSSIQCVASTVEDATHTSWTYPFNGTIPEAIPGAPSKCNCSTITLPIQPVNATATVAKTCNTALSQGAGLTSCDAGAEGSTVTYHVAISNTSSFGDIVIDQICDDQYGNVFTVSGYTGPDCPAGKVGTVASSGCTALDIAAGATQSCDFTAVQGELATVTDIVNVSGHSGVNTANHFGPDPSNSVAVTSEDAPSTAAVAKGLNATLAACATVRYDVTVHNSSSADEVEKLSAVNDSSFGDLTKLGAGTPGTVLGTTCGVANGIGTLTGTTGAGAFPATIAVGGDYKCKFDAQFCSAVDASTCISHLNTITATVVGDESGDVAFNPGSNTLTVRECLTPSTPPTP